MVDSKNLHRLAVCELYNLTETAGRNFTKKNIFDSIHKILPILNYLEENNLHEKVSKIKKIKNVGVQRKEFVEVCELIRANIQNVSS